MEIFKNEGNLSEAKDHLQIAMTCLENITETLPEIHNAIQEIQEALDATKKIKLTFPKYKT